MPAIFVAHGSPFLLDDPSWVGELAAWATDLPRPTAVLILSAHWVERPITLGATAVAPLTYDFYGFPERYYLVTYPAPGAPALADRIRQLLVGIPVVDSGRGLDHGAYVPLVAMYPSADIPVLQMSLPSLDPAALFALGQTLAPLRDEGVLIIGSGFLTHNMRLLDPRPDAPTPAWAAEFDEWVADVIRRGDLDALVSYRERAPGVRFALPSHEHFVPVIAAIASTIGQPGLVSFPITGFMSGSFTRRSIQFG